MSNSTGQKNLEAESNLSFFKGGLKLLIDSLPAGYFNIIVKALFIPFGR